MLDKILYFTILWIKQSLPSSAFIKNHSPVACSNPCTNKWVYVIVVGLHALLSTGIQRAGDSSQWDNNHSWRGREDHGGCFCGICFSWYSSAGSEKKQRNNRAQVGIVMVRWVWMWPWAQLYIYCYSGWLVGFVQYLYITCMCFTVQIYFFDLYKVDFFNLLHPRVINVI